MNLRCPDEFALGVVVGALLVTVVAPALTWSFLRVCRPCRERLRTQAATAATNALLAQRAELSRMASRERLPGPYTLLASAVNGVAIPAVEAASGERIGRIVYRDVALPAVEDLSRRVGLPVP